MKLEIKNAALGYQQKTILRNVNLEIHTGQTVCVLGRNGSGKTTLFRSLLGLLSLHSGEILLDGKDLSSWDRVQFARKVAYVPQARSLPFPFTVMDVVLFGRVSHLKSFASPGREDKAIAEWCLERLNILHLRKRVFTQLSGGEQQMVIVARALAQQPAFLIMDEPTSSLDFGNQIRIIRQVNALKDESLGILMATHSPDHAFMCNAKVAIVRNHTVMAQGACEKVITEGLLKDIYGTDIRIHALSDNIMTSRKVCVPDI
ncbi:ABC transporter ATP-binding protein [uncultured Bacteroides sp.]|uniref:ABC transporter ATP-binding protein n=1 Tax=uncultured Bacteroides sp. TaxID=162156 RepID=UPI002AAAC29D|nr:ABC transporter ATP-binding protein [uncultured Bacteroides sp.]